MEQMAILIPEACQLHTDDMAKLRTNNPGLRFLLDFWSKYCPLQDWHVDWAREHILVSAPLRKNQCLYDQGERQRNVYIVAKGLLARIVTDPYHGKRKILSVALPGMAMMTTDHLYSNTPGTSDIVTLRPQTIVIQIPYKAIKDFKEQERSIDTLIDIMGNKKKKQLAILRLVTHNTKPFEVYLRFAEEISQLQRILTNQECADLLGISVDTVYRAKRILLKK